MASSTTQQILVIGRSSAGQREYRKMMGGTSPPLQKGKHVHHGYPRVYAGKFYTHTIFYINTAVLIAFPVEKTERGFLSNKRSF